METHAEYTGELALDLANTLQLQRDGTTADLLAARAAPMGSAPGRCKRCAGMCVPCWLPQCRGAHCHPWR